MLDDLTESGPILEVLGSYCRRCRELAEAEGVDARDPDALRRWVLARLEVEDYRSPDGVVTRAINALVMRDANWHAIDFEHEPLGRYVWDLVAELAQPGPDGAIPGVPAPVAWYAVVGRFECAGAEYEVRVPGEGGGETPHLRVARLHDPSLPDVCVALHRPWYLPDGLHRWQLDGLHRDALFAFLGRPAGDAGSPTNWSLAVDLWHRFHGGRRPQGTMPAYEWLRYREGVTAAQGGQEPPSPPVERCLCDVVQSLSDGDLIDDGPLYDVLDERTRRCLELARGDGVDAADGDAVERWLRRRYDAGDADARSGMEALALVESDSVSDTLRHLRRKSAIDGLATEIVCMARDEEPRGEYVPDEVWDFHHGLVGTFTSGAATYEVRVFLEEPYEDPHFHVRRLRSPRTADVCIAIHEPRYVLHGPDRNGLRPHEVADLIGFLESHDDSGWLRMSKWVTVAYCWDDYREVGRDDPAYYAALEMPDYRGLHWPEEDD